MRVLTDNNLNYPALIEIVEGGSGSGSGFYLNLSDEAVYFITAKHVLCDLERSKLRGTKAHLLNYSKDISVIEPTLISVDLTTAEIIVSDKVDLAIIRIGTVKDLVGTDFQIVPGKGVEVINSPAGGGLVSYPSKDLKRFSEVLVSNHVYVMGYPVSLGLDGHEQFEKTRPLLRHGIVAGLNHKNKTVILDCPVYFGNSGGLAIEISEEYIGSPFTQMTRHAKVIGIVVEFVPFVEKMISHIDGKVKSVNTANSGYSIVVPSDHILELLAK